MSTDSKTKIFDSKSLTCFFVQTGFGTAFTYLTSGVFLSGLAILMGAGDVLISYMSVILNICGILILAFAAYLERFASRKRLTIILTVLSRFATLFIVVIPVLIPERLRLVLFAAAVIIAFTLQAQATVVLNQWMFTFVILLRTPDSEQYHSSVKFCRIHELVMLPLKNRRFTGFVIYIAVFYLLLNIADSFTMVYMMKYLALPYKMVTAMYMMISLPQVFLLGIWGKISDRCGHEFVLKTSIWLLAGETLFMFFASPEYWYIYRLHF